MKDTMHTRTTHLQRETKRIGEKFNGSIFQKSIQINENIIRCGAAAVRTSICGTLRIGMYAYYIYFYIYRYINICIAENI